MYTYKFFVVEREWSVAFTAASPWLRRRAAFVRRAVLMRYAREKTCSTDEMVALNVEEIIDCKSSVGKLCVLNVLFKGEHILEIFQKLVWNFCLLFMSKNHSLFLLICLKMSCCLQGLVTISAFCCMEDYSITEGKQ